MTEQKLSNANYFLQLLSECDFLKVPVVVVVIK